MEEWLNNTITIIGVIATVLALPLMWYIYKRQKKSSSTKQTFNQTNTSEESKNFQIGGSYNDSSKRKSKKQSDQDFTQANTGKGSTNIQAGGNYNDK